MASDNRIAEAMMYAHPPDQLARTLREEAHETMVRRRERPGYGTSPLLLEATADTLDRLRNCIDNILHAADDPELRGNLSLNFICEQLSEALGGR